MSEEEGGAASGHPPRGTTYPLNSKRLTAGVLSRIATALELPKAPLADCRQMIEGKLGEERETRNVQVDVFAVKEGSAIQLRDASGVFLDIPPKGPAGGRPPCS